MELRHEYIQSLKLLFYLIIFRNYDRALQLMQRATAVPPKRAAYYDKVVGVVRGVVIILCVHRVSQCRIGCIRI